MFSVSRKYTLVIYRQQWTLWCAIELEKGIIPTQLNGQGKAGWQMRSGRYEFAEVGRRERTLQTIRGNIRDLRS
ncbi:hypothetical protein [Aquabacter cavernae]|uniref:hypothetical protein n=1 Tax=Aquabacter cavernae TaxID=2496029 RepID=UPI000F8E3AFD|nr:hypothetical protein [Aquabacter cavernae]